MSDKIINIYFPVAFSWSEGLRRALFSALPCLNYRNLGALPQTPSNNGKSNVCLFLFVVFTLCPSVRTLSGCSMFCLRLSNCGRPHLSWHCAWGNRFSEVSLPKLTERCGPIVFCKSRESSHDLCSSLLLSQGCLKRQLVLQWGTIGCRGDHL